MKKIVRGSVLILTLAVGAASVAAIVSQTSWFKDWLRGFIVRQAGQYLNGTLTIGRLGGNLFSGIEMENIALSVDGSQVVAIKDLGLDYSPLDVWRTGVIRSIRIDQPVVYLKRDGDAWSISRLVKKQKREADRRGPAKPLSIDAIGISGGSIIVQSPTHVPGVDVPKRFEHLDAKLSFKYEPVRYSIRIAHVSLRASEPSLELNTVSGGIAVKDDTVFLDKIALRTAETSLLVDGAIQHYLATPILNLQISSDKTTVAEFARLVPALDGSRLQPSFNVKADGPLDRLKAEVNIQSSGGMVSGTVIADLVTPGQSVAGDLSLKHLDLSSFLGGKAVKSDITADTRLDLRAEVLSKIDGLRGTVAIESPRLVIDDYIAERVHANARFTGRQIGLDGNTSAYGATATFTGTLTLPDVDRHVRFVAYDVQGQANHVDLRNLPRHLNVPPAATDITGAYHVAGQVAVGEEPRVPWSVTGDLRFQASTVAGAGVADGSTAGVTANGSDVRYRADATIAQVDRRHDVLDDHEASGVEAFLNLVRQCRREWK